MNKRLRVAVASLGLAFVLAIVVGATGVVVPKNQRTAAGASTTLTIITGPVLVRHGTGEFDSADDGALLGPGDTIKTGPDARAVLTYFEGSTVEIEPGSELSIDTARANPDGSTVIVMKQELGVTWHVVTHLVQGGSRYEVHTNAATASVRGTAFTVGVEPDGTTTETTTEGAVANADAQHTSTVVTPPGQQTTTRTGQTPAPPKPAPEPERRVTVTIGDQNSLVVDTLGRANGIKDGKKVLQTPGALLQVVDGHLVVTLPNVPDGSLSTHFLGMSGDTDVTTKVEEKGRSAIQVTANVQAGHNTGVDIKKGSGENPSVKKKSGNDARGLPPPKVGDVPPAPPTEDNNSNDGKKKDIGAAGATGADQGGQGNGSTGSSDNSGGATVPGAGNANNGDRAGNNSGSNNGNNVQDNKPNDGKVPQLPAGGFAPGGIVPEIPTITQPGNNAGNRGPTENRDPNTNAGNGTNGNTGNGFLPRIEVPTGPRPATEKPRTEKPATERAYATTTETEQSAG